MELDLISGSIDRIKVILLGKLLMLLLERDILTNLNLCLVYSTHWWEEYDLPTMCYREFKKW